MRAPRDRSAHPTVGRQQQISSRGLVLVCSQCHALPPPRTQPAPPPQTPRCTAVTRMAGARCSALLALALAACLATCDLATATVAEAGATRSGVALAGATRSGVALADQCDGPCSDCAKCCDNTTYAGTDRSKSQAVLPWKQGGNCTISTPQARATPLPTPAPAFTGELCSQHVSA